MSEPVPFPDDVLGCPDESFAKCAWVKLRRFGAYMAARFNAPVYLVGSALRKSHPRDIDVRVVLTEEHFKARYGIDSDGWLQEGPSQKWIDEVGKFCADESTRQRLPIDFQVYPARHSTQYLGQPRVLLAGPTGAIDHAQAIVDADIKLADELAANAT